MVRVDLHCKTCRLNFDSSSKRDNHHRLVHQPSVRVTYADDNAVVHIHRKDGIFVCARTLCAYTTDNPKRMFDHGKSCMASGDETARPVPDIKPIGNAATIPSTSKSTTSVTSTGTLLERLRLIISPELNMLICQDCGVTIAMRYIISHMKQHHRNRLPHLEWEHLKVDLSRLGLLPPDSMSEEAVEVCTPGPKLKPVVPGLPLKDGYQCMQCFKSYSTNKLCKDHQRKTHGDSDQMKIREVRIQTFGQGPGMNVNFAVDDTASVGIGAPPSFSDFSSAARLAAKVAHEANRVETETLDRSRDWPPYFRYLEWPEMLEDLERSQPDIHAQFSLPRNSEYGRRLRTYVSRLMKQIRKGIKNSDVLLRRRIKSAGSPFKLELHPFSKLQESSEDYANFLAIWIHFVLGAARGVHSFLEVDEECGRAECRRLYEHVIDSPQEGRDAEEHEAAGTELLHAVLEKIFLRVRRYSESECNEICYRSIFMLSVAKPRVLMARDVTPLISRFMYWIRGIVLLAIDKLMVDLDSHGGDSCEAARLEEEGMTNLLKFSSDGHRCPFGSIVQAKRVLQTFSLSESVSDWLVEKNGDPRVLILGGSTLELQSVSLMIRTLTQELHDDLEEVLMLGMPCNNRIMESLHGPHMVDRFDEGQQGYSFLQESANRCYRVRNALIDWIFDNPGLRDRFVKCYDERGMPVWRCGSLDIWFKAVGVWIRKLMVVLHLVTGLPGRGTEVVEYRYRNALAGRRTLYISQDLVMFRPTYFKTNSHSGIVKHLYRFADAKTSKIVVKYLTFVRLLEVTWCRERYGPESLPLYHSFLFVDRGRMITAETFGAQLKKVFADRLEVRLGVAKWRHIAEFWGERFCFRDRPHAVVTAMHEQAGHTEETADLVYARSTDEFLEANAHSMALFRTATSAWHSMLGLKGDSNATSAVITRETVPTYSIPQLVPMSGGCSNIDTTAGSSNQVTSDNIPSGPLYKECRPDVQRALKSLGHSGFKSPQQGEALHHVLNRRDDILAVLPTGGGKTLLFQLAALLEPNHIQIVVCPFRALTSELIKRCREVGLKAMRWGGDSDSLSNLTDCHLLFVAMEHIGNRKLQDEIAQQHYIKRVSRYVMDECHVLISDREWRHCTQNVWQLRKHAKPLLLLSGSLPPTMQKELEEVFCLSAPLIVIRASCQRPNIVYTVERRAGECEMRARLLWWLDKAHGNNNGGAALVFCRTVSLTQELCHWLQEQHVRKVSYYHAKLSDEVKEHTEKAWEMGEISIMVATSAFGTGMDKSNVRVVVHYQQPYSTLNFVQESGRAGRDNVKSWHCVLLREDWETSRDQEKDDTLCTILTTRSCRRIHIEAYLDGDGRDCFMSGSALCDNCEGICEICDREGELVVVEEEGVERAPRMERVAESARGEFRPWEPEYEDSHTGSCQITAGRDVHRSTQNSLAAANDTTKSAHSIVEFTEQLIAKTCLSCLSSAHDTRHHGGGRCYQCLAKGHFVTQCTNRGISWESGTACFACGLPRSLQGVELHNENMGTKCNSKGKDHYVPWAWLTWHHRSDPTNQSRAILQEAGVPDHIQSDADFKQWLGNTHRLLKTNFVSLLVSLIVRRNQRDLVTRRGMACKRRDE